MAQAATNPGEAQLRRIARRQDGFERLHDRLKGRVEALESLDAERRQQLDEIVERIGVAGQSGVADPRLAQAIEGLLGYLQRLSADAGISEETLATVIEVQLGEIILPRLVQVEADVAELRHAQALQGPRIEEAHSRIDEHDEHLARHDGEISQLRQQAELGIEQSTRAVALATARDHTSIAAIAVFCAFTLAGWFFLANVYDWDAPWWAKLGLAVVISGVIAWMVDWVMGRSSGSAAASATATTRISRVRAARDAFRDPGNPAPQPVPTPPATPPAAPAATAPTQQQPAVGNGAIVGAAAGSSGNGAAGAHAAATS